ncbi:hypothetical protein BSN85_08770 [Bradyrhizobium brasilense]|nr:hypothetical protein BSN85_08770 [Bradyrhizobium brasilense]
MFALIALNFIGIALSEVQRRALVYQSIDAERQMALQVETIRQAQIELKLLQERQVRVLAWHDSKVDRVVASLLVPQAQQDAKQSLAALSRERDASRIRQVVILRAALDHYHADHGVFPGPFADSSIEDLRGVLVGGRYIESVPDDPLRREQLRYTTDGAADGQRYGLKVWLENGGNCLTGLGFESSGWWGALPACPF